MYMHPIALSVTKRALFGLAVTAALGVTSTFAASPAVSDANSAYWTARVAGNGFTVSTSSTTQQALVEVYNAADGQTFLKLVDTSQSQCIGPRCSAGGSFVAEFAMYPHQCTTRTARAYDFGSGVWTGYINLGCH